MEYYSAIQKNEMPFAAIWMDLEIITVSKVRKRYKISYDITHVESKISFPGSVMVKKPPANAGDVRDVGLIPGLGRAPGERNGNQLKYFCLENFKDRGAWRAVVQGVARSQTQVSKGGDKTEPDSQAQSTDKWVPKGRWVEERSVGVADTNSYIQDW